MSWPNWSVDERSTLARYVLSDVAQQISLGVVRDDAIKRGDRLTVVHAIYDALLKLQLHYSREVWSPQDGPQVIRDPAAIFRGGNATCLDLALLFAGTCLGHELLPLVVLVEGHAFVAVSLLDDPRDPVNRARLGRDGPWINEGMLSDSNTFSTLIEEDSGHYLPVECTGFAKTVEIGSDVPEGSDRKEGYLDFEAAVKAGRAQSIERQFLFAIDPAVRQRVKMVAPYARTSEVEEISERVRSLFDESQKLTHEKHEIDFENSYLSQVAKKYGRVETLGVRDLKDFRQSLTLAYVSLCVKNSERGSGASRRQAEYVLESEPLLTVRASAGAGKTTLLNWIALACAQGATKESNDRWQGGVPFFVPLRALRDGGLPNIGRFIDYTIDSKQWPRPVPPGWIVKVLEGKRAVIMLDGVDELAPKSRAEFWKWVNDDLLERYPGNRIIITSRYLPDARPTNWQPPTGFAAADLDEMTDDDVNHSCFVGMKAR
jgi:hypothetical protein